MDFFPHAPLQKIDARIMSIYGAASQAGTDQVVTINRGSMQGVDPGTVLELHRRGVTVRDATDGNKAMSLPDHVVGRLFVFRVFEKLSYGLIMQVNDAVKLGDVARSPE